MHEFVSFNSRTIPAESSFLSAVSSTALYGKGIFTTVAFYDSKPFQWKKHRQRLITAAEKLQIDLTNLTGETLEIALFEIAETNRMRRGRARLTIFDETASRLWTAEPQQKTSFLVQTTDFRVVPNAFRLTISPFSVNSQSPLCGLKTCNYLENILALDAAMTAGFNEVVRLNERKETVSAAMANIFWVKNGEIFTASLQTGCLAGTTRALLIENFPVAEAEAQLREVLAADEVFITSVGIGIVKVVSIDSRLFPAESTKTNELKDFFKSLTER